MTGYITSIVFGYLLGSIPFGLVITRLAGLGDIRKIGSGNIGATNVLRTGRKDLALLTLLFDLGKAALAAVLMRTVFHSEVMGFVAGFSAVIGHNFPVWLHFKGGKGVASTLGMMLVLTPITGVLTCLTWLFMAFIFHYSSLSALTALILAPVYAFVFSGQAAVICYALLGILSLWRHRANIKRLLTGQESKINFKKAK
ncbi:MAG: glycerol-3-phosphate 1-O-acyltransferase PlsY [Alphaproteobacteria bacterium]|nr:glycerol-3-phosphate 1-O-acyltransferase PlsY [Alphaproteobacteria bacterium]